MKISIPNSHYVYNFYDNIDDKIRQLVDKYPKMQYPFLDKSYHLFITDKETKEPALLIEFIMLGNLMVIFNMISFTNNAYTILKTICETMKVSNVCIVNSSDRQRTARALGHYGFKNICSLDLYIRSV